MSRQLTDAQHKLVGALDDTAEHVAWKFDQSEYEGPSTIGFASIDNINGRKSFVRSVQSASRSDSIDWIQERRDKEYRIEIGHLEMDLSSSYSGGYSLKVLNISDIVEGPKHQRLDLREKIHSLVLNRLRTYGYLEDARIRSRMD